jgi:hypothetical protein
MMKQYKKMKMEGKKGGGAKDVCQCNSGLHFDPL